MGSGAVKITRFEDIDAWRGARELVQRLYQVSEQGEFVKDFGLRDQIRRASVSVMANIAEGFDSHSDGEFIHFLIYARRSASEVQSHLYVALDQRYVTREEFDKLYDGAVQVKNLISGFIRYLRGDRASIKG